MDSKHTKNYLLEVLVNNPLTKADIIIMQRHLHLGLAPRISNWDSGSDRIEGELDYVKEAVDLIRQKFWSLSSVDLDQQLASSEFEIYPELAYVIQRLKSVAAIRDQYPKLASRLKHNIDLLNHLKQSVTLPPSESAGLRESVIRSMLTGDTAWRLHQAAKIVKKEFPDIYAVENQWIDEILATRKRSIFAIPKFSWPYSIPLWLAVIVIINIIRAIMRFSNG